jgi:hypothetical protein
MYMGLVMLGRLKYMQLSPLYASLVPPSFKMATEKFKMYKSPAFITFQQNWFKQEVGDYAVRSINCLTPNVL